VVCNIALAPYILPFLFLCNVTVVVMLSTIVVSHFGSFFGETQVPEGQKRFEFAVATQTLGRYVVRAYRMSLLLFLGTFGLWGYVRMNPQRIEPAFCCVVGGLIFVCVGVNTQRKYTQALKMEVAMLLDPNYSIKHDKTEMVAHKQLTNQLNTWPTRGLFFGGFAYYAVLLFLGADRRYAGLYLFFIGVMFGLSIAITGSCVIIKLRLAKFGTPTAKEHFCASLKTTMQLLFICYNVMVLTFFLAVTTIPFIKPGFAFDFPVQYGYPAVGLGAIGTALAMCLIVYGQVGQTDARKLYSDKMSIIRTSGAVPYNLWKEITTNRNTVYATQATFVAGRGFYEIMQSDANVTDAIGRISTYIYFSLNGTIAVCAGLTVIACTMVAQGLSADKAYTKLPLESMIFWMFNSATFCSLAALCFLDRVKFQPDAVGSTLGWGLFALVVLLVGFFSLRMGRATAKLIIEGGLAGEVRLKMQPEISTEGSLHNVPEQEEEEEEEEEEEKRGGGGGGGGARSESAVVEENGGGSASDDDQNLRESTSIKMVVSPSQSKHSLSS